MAGHRDLDPLCRRLCLIQILLEACEGERNLVRLAPKVGDGIGDGVVIFQTEQGVQCALFQFLHAFGDVVLQDEIEEGLLHSFLSSPANEGMGAFSPDGRWMACASGDSDPTTEVFVRAYPDGGSLRQISEGAGFLPKWTKGGRELVYGAPSPIGMAMMAVGVAVEGPALVLGKPHQLFELPFTLLASATSFDAAADGNRFAVILSSPAAQAIAPKRLHVTVVLNFFDDIRRAIEGK